VADQSPRLLGDERQPDVATISQRIREPGFILLSERRDS
jgi:hypothetical protein